MQACSHQVLQLTPCNLFRSAGPFGGFELCYRVSRFHKNMTLYIAVIGTSDQSCWLAEACKSPSLEGVWIYGFGPYYAVTDPKSMCHAASPKPRTRI